MTEAKSDGPKLLDVLGQIGLHDHLCLIYESHEEHLWEAPQPLSTREERVLALETALLAAAPPRPGTKVKNAGTKGWDRPEADLLPWARALAFLTHCPQHRDVARR